MAFTCFARAAARSSWTYLAFRPREATSRRAASYAASKWGVVGFTKSLAEELRGTGLQSVAILPGSVDTHMLVGSGLPPLMSADDVAKMIVHAALDAPDAINGSAIELFG